MINIPEKPEKAAHAAWSFAPDGTAVVKDTEQSIFYPLNEVGALIWDLIDGEHDVAAIADVVTNEYDVAHEDALIDVREFLSHLTELDLIQNRKEVKFP